MAVVNGDYISLYTSTGATGRVKAHKQETVEENSYE